MTVRNVARVGVLLLWSMVAGCSAPEAGETPLLGLLERERVEVSAESREAIVELAVRSGDAVLAGQVLARLDDSRAVATFDAAEARMQRIEGRLAELLRGGRNEVLDQARARIVEARAVLAQAEIDARRIDRLRQADVASQSQVDSARLSVDTARARLDVATASLTELLAGATSEELQQTRADYDAAQAESRLARIEIDRQVLRAPMAGKVDAVIYRLGERPEPGLPVVVLLAAGAPYVRVQVPELLRASVVPGTVATIQADGVEQELTGKVRFVASEATFTPYYALSEHDRHRLSFVSEIALQPTAEGGAATNLADLPSGLPVRVSFAVGTP